MTTSAPEYDSLAELIITHQANGITGAPLADVIRVAVSEQVRRTCPWTAHADLAEISHEDYHFGYTCPYEAAAAVLRGEPDPRESNPRDQAGDQHRTQVWRTPSLLGWDCLDCPAASESEPADLLAAERDAEWHARHPHHRSPRAGALAEVQLGSVDWRALLVFFEGTTVRVSDDGFQAWLVFPDGREASEQDLLIIVSADPEPPTEHLTAAGMTTTDRAVAAHSLGPVPREPRYTPSEPQRLARMALGNCPECGQPPDYHGDGVPMLSRCALTVMEVHRTLVQYRADREGVSER